MRNPLLNDDLIAISDMDFLAEYFAETSVLVTGAAGFLGSYFVHALLYLNRSKQTNIRVLGLVRNIESAQHRFADELYNPALRLIANKLDGSLEIEGPIDTIVHAASQASPAFYKNDPLGTIMPNVFGTHALLSLAHAKKSKSFLFFSSSEVYGVLPNDKIPIDENSFGHVDPMNVRSCYAESKRMGENLCASWHAKYGVPTRIVRLFHTYGPGLRLDDGRVFSDFIGNVVRNEDIVLLSDGSAVRAYCYVSDALRGIFFALCRGVEGGAYNVGNDDAGISVSDLARKIVKLFPEKNLKVISKERDNKSAYIPSPIARNCPNTEKIRKLGWIPRIGIEEGFKRAIESYQYEVK